MHSSVLVAKPKTMGLPLQVESLSLGANCADQLIRQVPDGSHIRFKHMFHFERRRRNSQPVVVVLCEIVYIEEWET